MVKRYSYIPTRLKNAAENDYVAGAEDILDDALNKTQEEINGIVLTPSTGIDDRLKTIEQGVTFEGTIQTEINPANVTSGSAKVPTGNAVRGAIDVRTGFFKCTTASNTAAKAVTADGYVLSRGGGMRIWMEHANTADNATLNINSTGAKALFYNGERAGSGNTWGDEETITVYYDETANSNAGAYFASNAQGGGGKAEKIKYDNSQSGLSAENVQGALDEVGGNIDAKYSWMNKNEYTFLPLYGFATGNEGFVNVTGTNKTKYTHNVIKVPEGYTRIKVKAGSERISCVCFVTEYSIPSENNESISFCEEYPTRVDIPAGEVFGTDIPNDCTYIIVNVLGNNQDFSPEYVLFGSASSVVGDTSHIRFKQVFTSSLSGWSTNLNGVLIGNVFLYDSTKRLHKVIERDTKAKYVRISAASEHAAYIGLLRSYSGVSSGRTMADLCSSEIGIRIIGNGTTQILAIPDDCNYIVFNQLLSTNDACLPSEICWGYDDTLTKEYDSSTSKLREKWNGYALGIIGDSISTYAGYIMPNANTEYGIDYISGNTNFGKRYGVSDVSMTWWKMFANSCGFSCIQNLSSAGSGVIYRDISMLGLWERVQLLEDDCRLVIIALGANDAGQSQPLGDYDWESSIEELDDTEFIPCLIKSIKYIQANYPNAKIMLFCTSRTDTDAALPYTTAEATIAEHLGCLYLNMTDLYTLFCPYNNPSNYHPSVNQMNFIFEGLMDYVLTKEFVYAENAEYTELSELALTTANGSIDLANGTVVSASDTNRICTGFIDVGDADILLVRKAHLTRDFLFGCYDSDKNYLGYSVSYENGAKHKLCAGTRYVRRSLSITGQVISNDFKIYAIAGSPVQQTTNDGIDIYLSDFMNPLQTDQQNIEDCIEFASGFDKKSIHFDVERLVVSNVILLEGNTTVYLENCTIKQADGMFENVFRSANLDRSSYSDYITMPDDIPVIENIKIIGVGKANIIGPDVNAVDGQGNPMIGDEYGMQTWQICMVRTNGVEIGNIGFTKTRCWCITFELCENVSVHDISVHSTIENGDGIDFRVGCKHCEVYNINGYTEDDLVACTALGDVSAPPSSAEYTYKPTWKLWSGLKANDPTALDIEDIHVHDCYYLKDTTVHPTSGHGMICLSAYGSKVHHISVDKFYERSEVAGHGIEALVKIYHGFGSGYTDGDLHTIRLNNIQANISDNTLMVKGGIVEDVRANKLVNNLSGGSVVSVSDGNVIGTNVIVTNS